MSDSGQRFSNLCGRALIHAALLACCAVCVYPLLRIFSVSLRPGDMLLSTDLSILPPGATLLSYKTLLGDTFFLRWLWNSLVITASTSFIGVTLASAAAYAFSRFSFPGRRL